MKVHKKFAGLNKLLRKYQNRLPDKKSKRQNKTLRTKISKINALRNTLLEHIGEAAAVNDVESAPAKSKGIFSDKPKSMYPFEEGRGFDQVYKVLKNGIEHYVIVEAKGGNATLRPGQSYMGK